MNITDEQRLAFAGALGANLEGVVGLHAIVEERRAKLAQAEEALRVAVERVAAEERQARGALGALGEASEGALKKARLIGLKLETAALEGAISEAVYRETLARLFPRGPQTLGQTPRERVDALRVAHMTLEGSEADPTGELAALAKSGVDAIEAANASAKQNAQGKEASAAALEEARVAFDRGYRATKEILSGLLRDADRLPELKDLFPDL